MVARIQEDPIAFWGEAMAEEEPLRESRFPLVEFQTAIAWRIIDAALAGPPRTVLDAGAGTGRYSLPLAAQGHHVTHLDVSGAMLRRAMAAAARQELSTIAFREGDVRDLSAFDSRAFEATLCLDAPLSYAWPRQAEAVAEVCRVTAELLILMVSSRSGVLPYMVDFDMSGAFVPPGQEAGHDPFFLTEHILRDGVEEHPPEFRDWLAEEGKLTPPDYAFTIPELTALLARHGFTVERLGGPCALARSVRPETLERIRTDRALFERFIGYSLAFDFDPHNAGLGGVNLMLVARRSGAGGFSAAHGSRAAGNARAGSKAASKTKAKAATRRTRK